jgi:hypothetical protein
VAAGLPASLPPVRRSRAVPGGSVSGRQRAGGGAWRAVNTLKSSLQGHYSASCRMRPRAGSLIGWSRMVAVVALEEHALPGRDGGISQARDAAPDQMGSDLLIRLGREGGAGDLGDLGVRDSARVLGPPDRFGLFDQCPGIVADAGNSVPDGGVLPHRTRFSSVSSGCPAAWVPDGCSVARRSAVAARSVSTRVVEFRGPGAGYYVPPHRGPVAERLGCPESGMSPNPPLGNAVHHGFSRTIEVSKHVWI